jgi:hypothetical protein
VLRNGVIRLAGLGLCLLPGAVGHGQALDAAAGVATPEQDRAIWSKSATKDVVEVEIPSGTEAMVSLPFVGQVLENGRPVVTTADERGHRSSLTLHRAGTFRYSVKPEGSR